MFNDPALIRAWRSRTAHDHAVNIVLEAWSGAPPECRAALIASQGDVVRAGACGGEGWRQLAEGDVLGALRVARARHESGFRNSPNALLEAEALFAAGAVVASLNRLEKLHWSGDVSATLALSRRRHLLGDHAGAEHAASALPVHAHAALTGARAALIGDRVEAALRFVGPFLEGAAPIPEPAVAGAFAVVAASILARNGELELLKAFAGRLLSVPDIAEDMMPTVARAAWIAGLAEPAWRRFASGQEPWMLVARLELAGLAGDAALASKLLTQVGLLGAPARMTMLLLNGLSEEIERRNNEHLFGEGGGVVHIWRTHPYRWQPWIKAMRRITGDLEVYNLSRKELPDEQAIPQAALDDGSLIEVVEPEPVPAQAVRGTGIWIDEPLCRGIGIGHDWPEEETRRMAHLVTAVSRDDAAVWVVGADAALRYAHEGRAMVVVAPPGDPFWAGPLPECAWPAMSILRAAPGKGWAGAGDRAIAVAQSLISQAV